MSWLKPSLSGTHFVTDSATSIVLSRPPRRSRARPAEVPGPGGPCTRGRRLTARPAVRRQPSAHRLLPFAVRVAARVANRAVASPAPRDPKMVKIHFQKMRAPQKGLFLDPLLPPASALRRHRSTARTLMDTVPHQQVRWLRGLQLKTLLDCLAQDWHLEPRLTQISRQCPPT